MKRQASAIVPTSFGSFEIIAYADDQLEQMPHLAILHPEANLDAPILMRIHSECFTGDVLHSKKCDCGEQLDAALEKIRTEKGLLIYLRQEGRGIGLINKLKAYKLQEEGHNTIDVNLHLGLGVDERKYDLAIEILEDLGIKEIDLMTNNPKKIEAIEKSSIILRKRVPHEIIPNAVNRGYLKTKQQLMGHKINL